MRRRILQSEFQIVAFVTLPSFEKHLNMTMRSIFHAMFYNIIHIRMSTNDLLNCVKAMDNIDGFEQCVVSVNYLIFANVVTNYNK